jgi:hypothetical protein
MELKFEVYGRIEKPVAEVFDAVYKPESSAATSPPAGPAHRWMKAPP